jgi:hypothetical protein
VRAQQQAVAQFFRFLPGDEKGVLRVARGMVRRKIQGLEVVVIGFNLRTFFDRVAELRKTPTISFIVLMTGCSAPMGRRMPGRVMSSRSAAILPDEAPL